MSSAPATEPGRLNGWKEIALHLGKGTRTAQRWEKIYGLPVHRLGREGGEIVFAFRDEIDRWVAASEQERAAGEREGNGTTREEKPGEDAGARAPEGGAARRALRRARRWALPLLLLGLAVFGTLALWRPKEGFDAGRQPASWRLANETLTVFDARGSTLFEHRFGFPLHRALTSESRLLAVGPAPVVIADVDGDGRSEVLVNVNALERANRKLYCFEADGRLRFVHQPTGTRRFGDVEYAEPWLAHRVFATRGVGGARRLWAVFTHGFLFPAVLRQLDPRDGAVRQEYWGNGYIEVVHEDTWAGRRVLLVGGTNNDFRAASLAVFPPDGVAGSTPAVRPGYACRDCAPGGPEALFLFPTLCIARDRTQASVHEAWIEKGESLRVSLEQAGGASYYTLGPGGELRAAEISREFVANHAILERRGVIDHPFGPADDQDMFPVRRWDGERFVELPSVPVDH
jgi:hypothetical protein